MLDHDRNHCFILLYFQGFPGFGFGDGGFHMSFGIGAFPFGFFTSTFNFGETRPSAGKLKINLFILLP